MKYFKIFFTVLLVVSQGMPISARQQEFLETFLAVVEEQALNSPSVNWLDVKSRARAMASNASKTSDTYPAIAYVLAQLRDNHSYLQTPDGADFPIPGRSWKSSPRRVLRSGNSRLLRSNKGQIGYVVVGSVSGERGDVVLDRYCAQLRSSVSTFNQARPVGWIVDLRQNGGGNMWPMLVGIGPILGEGTLGYFKERKGYTPWFYRKGRAGLIAQHLEQEMFSVNANDVPSDISTNSSVAVLIDGGTGSSGEAVAISFLGKHNVRFFGEKTAGLSTGNETINLTDGATLFLTTSIMADRNRKLYLDGIKPDLTISTVGSDGRILVGTSTDPVLGAAIKWIER